MSFAWSYSSLQAFETCPKRWNLTKRLKQVKEPQTEATLDGNRKHKVLELAIKGEQYLPEEYKKWVPLVERIRATPGRVQAERKFALTADFRETTYFGKDVWLRGVLDVSIVNGTHGTVLDWKAGKRKPDADQLKLFAVAAFKLDPYLETVDTGYVWLRDKKIDRETFTQDDAPAIWQDFMIRVARIEQAIEKDSFPARPSGLCREWCPVGKRLCEHCGG